MSLTIEMMTENHIDQVLDIEKASFSSPWSRTAFESEISEDHKYAYYIVAEDSEESEVMGYLGAWFILNEAHITNVAVNPAYRRQGIAAEMIDHLVEVALKHGIDAVTLEVRVSNVAAQNLYQKLGFEKAGVRPNYYQDNNEDALIMWKLLKNGSPTGR